MRRFRDSMAVIYLIGGIGVAVSLGLAIYLFLSIRPTP
jgi:K+-transporting ATPase KdpF subunit